MTKRTMRAAIYTRVSTREQAVEGYSLDAQERLLTDFCKIKKYDIFKLYSDKGISAKDIIHRPGMLELLQDAKLHKFDIVLVWKLTRFSRNMTDLITTCEELDRLGIALVSYSEAFDSGTPAGRMIRSMLGTVAQFEREVIGENISLAMLERAKQGKRTCNELLGYDLSGPDSFSINEKEAEYINFVHNNYLLRKNISEVAELAREKGFCGKRGKVPTPWSIYVILTRPQYAGYNVFKGQLYKGNYKPIRTVQQFNQVQRLLMRQGKLAGRPRAAKLYILPDNTDTPGPLK